MNKNDGAASLVRSDVLLAAMKSYRCQYTIDQDGGGLDLVDALSPGETVAEGLLELELLAEHLDAALDEANSPICVKDSGEKGTRKCRARETWRVRREAAPRRQPKK